MGSCISKSRRKSTPPSSPSSPSSYSSSKGQCCVQDKLVIVSSNPDHHPPQVSSPPPSSSSSFSCSNTSSSASASLSNTSSSSSSCSCSSSSIPKDKSSFSNDYLWSCMMENPHIMIPAALDHKADHTIPKNLLAAPTNFHTRKTELPPNNNISSSPSKKNKKKQSAVVHPILQKRACSSSTTPSSPNNIVSRQKSFRRDQLLPDGDQSCRHDQQVLTSSVPAARRNNNLGVRYSSSPIRRSKGCNDTCKSSRNDPRNKKIWNDVDGHEEFIGIYKNSSKSNGSSSTVVPIHSSSPSSRNIEETHLSLARRHNSSLRSYKRNDFGDKLATRKKQVITSTTNTTHHIDPEVADADDHSQIISGVRETAVFTSSSCSSDDHDQEKEHYLMMKSAVVSSPFDDIDNPLISLDCFIFL